MLQECEGKVGIIYIFTETPQHLAGTPEEWIQTLPQESKGSVGVVN